MGLREIRFANFIMWICHGFCNAAADIVICVPVGWSMVDVRFEGMAKFLQGCRHGSRN
jgi:hypothetical protein